MISSESKLKAVSLRITSKILIGFWENIYDYALIYGKATF